MKYQLSSILACLGAFASAQLLASAPRTNSNDANTTMTPAPASVSASTMTENMVITPNANPIVDGGCDVYVDAEFIYWSAKQEGLAYASTGALENTTAAASPLSTTATGSNSTLSQGQTYFVHGKMSPGFKVGAGLDLRHDGWDLYLDYTWLHSHRNNSVTLNQSTGSDVVLGRIVPTYDFANAAQFPLNGVSSSSITPLTGIARIGSAQGIWNLKFNNFDLELGRNFFISPRLVLRPHFGLKGSWLRQNFDAKYQDMFAATALPATTAPTTLTQGYYNIAFVQHYWGVGIRTGLDAAWQFDSNWSIYGDWALSALYGKFSVSREDTFSNLAHVPAIINGQVVNVSNQYHGVNAVLELALGLRYDYWFSDDAYRFRMQAGWEEQVWFNQNQMLPVAAVANDDLVFQGLTVKFRFDF